MLRAMGKDSIKCRDVAFERADFTSLRQLMGGMSWEAALKGEGEQGSWQAFKSSCLQVPEECSPVLRRTGTAGDHCCQTANS